MQSNLCDRESAVVPQGIGSSVSVSSLSSAVTVKKVKNYPKRRKRSAITSGNHNTHRHSDLLWRRESRLARALRVFHILYIDCDDKDPQDEIDFNTFWDQLRTQNGNDMTECYEWSEKFLEQEGIDMPIDES